MLLCLFDAFRAFDLTSMISESFVMLPEVVGLEELVVVAVVVVVVSVRIES